MSFISNMFGGKKPAPGPGGSGGPAAVLPVRDERKASKFFQHAKTLGETGNFDYAIECYVSGLRHDPTNMFQHEALRELAKKRRVAGGKPAGPLEKLKHRDTDPIGKMTNVAERFWSMKPLDPELLVQFMSATAGAHIPEQGLDMREVMIWTANLLLKERTFEKPPTLQHYMTVTDLLYTVGVFDLAVEACKIAVGMDKNNPVLYQRLKDIDTERSLVESRQKQSSREAVKDLAKQEELILQDALTVTEQQAEQRIVNAEKAWKNAPDDLDLRRKYIAALTSRDTEKHDELAAAQLKDAFEKTQQYRFKQELGDLRIRAFDRKLRALKKKMDANPAGAAEDKKTFQEVAKQKLMFEVGEYEERVKNLPTDRAMKYELARRYLDLGRVEECMPLLQTAKTDPRLTTKACLVLGRAFMRQQWFDLAISAFDEGLKAHPAPTDPIGLELHYSLMDAKEKMAVKVNEIAPLIEAQKHASIIMQNNIGFRDTRARLDGMNKLIDKIKSGGSQAGGAAPAPGAPA